MFLKERLYKNRYKLIIAAFLLWMIFFDKNNFIDQYKLREQYSKVLEEKEYYQAQIEQARKEREQLFTDEQALEKFAREKYHMKKDEEEVFIVVEEEKK